MRYQIMIFLITIIAVVPLQADKLQYKNQLIDVLVKQVPGILENYDAETGRFGEGIWISTDQNRMYPLAAAYSYKHSGNPYYKDKHLLRIITKAGDALIDDMDEQGQWEFRKKDGSTWGPILMPWIYSRWIRSFQLIRDDMPPEHRKAWNDALTLGYMGISKTQLYGVHNIPTHHAMGLYIAGKSLDRPEWCQQATDFMRKVVSEQKEGGYWSEHVGPVVGYNFVYIDALGTYYAISKDQRILPGLKKSSNFHRYFTYPDGARIETIDERNPYHEGIDPGNVGFTFTPSGRTYLHAQWSRYGWEKLPADLIASLLLYGQEGLISDNSSSDSEHLFVLKESGKDGAATMRNGSWFVCLSAYTAPIPKSRWIQDRQNLVSIFHDKVGLILGGGNTKLQPLWSNFTVGDKTLLRHQSGDTNPDFIPKGELFHTPLSATLVREPDIGLDLKYGEEECRIRTRIIDRHTLEYRIDTTSLSSLPVYAHLTLIPHINQSLKTESGQQIILDKTPIAFTAEQVGGAIAHAGYKLHLPKTATLHWPVLPHNPYRKDGHAFPAEGRIVIRIPFDKQHTAYTVKVEILQ